MSMKVILVNGSPHKSGCTFTALNEVAKSLNNEGIETDIFWIGNRPIGGCINCKMCEKNHRCVFDDKVNEFLKVAKDYDGFIFGSPVHWASAGGAITSFMDRVFYADLNAGLNSFRLKPAAAVANARRAGTTATLDQLNKYFELMQMPIISSQILEYDAWLHARRGASGPRRHAGDARVGQKHGFLPEVQEDGDGGRIALTRAGRGDIH
jgi:multimeric flavodoxin WrbA